MVGSRYDAPHCDYSDKGKAIRALTGDNRFTKDIDYMVSPFLSYSSLYSSYQTFIFYFL